MQEDVFFRIQPPVRRITSADAPVVLIKRMPFVFGQGLPVVPVLRRVIKRGPVCQIISESNLAELLRGCCAGLFHDSISCLRLFRLFFLIFRDSFLCFFRDILLNGLFLRIAVLCMDMLFLPADQDFPGRIAAVIMDMFFHTADQVTFFVITVLCMGMFLPAACKLGFCLIAVSRMSMLLLSAVCGSGQSDRRHDKHISCNIDHDTG